MLLKACVLNAPSNIARIVIQIRQELFSRHGLASSQALPVIMPISWHPASVSETDFRAAVGDHLRAFPICASEYRLQGEALFLMAARESAGEPIWPALKRRLEALPAISGTPPFPAAFGFFLADRERRVVPSALAEMLGRPPAFRFNAFTCSLLTLTAPDPPRLWWQEAYWELSLEIRARKRRN